MLRIKNLLSAAAIWLLLLTTVSAQDISNASVEELRNQISALNELGKTEEAFFLLQRALTRFPDDAMLNYITAEMMWYYEDFDAALYMYNRTIELDSTNYQFYLGRGIFLDRLKDFEGALTDIEQAIILAPNDSVRYSLYGSLGSVYSSVRSFDTAYTIFSEALAYHADDPLILNGMALVCDEMGKYAESLSCLERALELDSTFFGTYINLGFYYQNQKEYEASIPYFNKAQELEPNSAYIYSNRAFSQLELGKTSQAMLDVNKSIELDPSNSWAYKVRAKIYLIQEEDQLACQDLETALELGYSQIYGEEVDNLRREHCLTMRH